MQDETSGKIGSNHVTGIMRGKGYAGGRSIADFRLQIFDCRFSIADFRLQIFDCRFSIADFRLRMLGCPRLASALWTLTWGWQHSRSQENCRASLGWAAWASAPTRVLSTVSDLKTCDSWSR